MVVSYEKGWLRTFLGNLNKDLDGIAFEEIRDLQEKVGLLTHSVKQLHDVLNVTITKINSGKAIKPTIHENVISNIVSVEGSIITAFKLSSKINWLERKAAHKEGNWQAEKKARSKNPGSEFYSYEAMSLKLAKLFEQKHQYNKIALEELQIIRFALNHLWTLMDDLYNKVKEVVQLKRKKQPVPPEDREKIIEIVMDLEEGFKVTLGLAKKGAKIEKEEELYEKKVDTKKNWWEGVKDYQVNCGEIGLRGSSFKIDSSNEYDLKISDFKGYIGLIIFWPPDGINIFVKSGDVRIANEDCYYPNYVPLKLKPVKMGPSKQAWVPFNLVLYSKSKPIAIVHVTLR